MAYIELKHVSYQYPTSQKQVLQDINETFEQGKIYGIIGANEAGKTTLSQLLIGFIPFVYGGHLSGQVIVDKVIVNEADLNQLIGKVGYIFQNPFNQVSGIKDTVYEEIAYGLENLGVEKKEMIERIDVVLRLLGIEELKDRNPFELSGGQLQKVAFAASYVMDLDIFVLDEPVSQLDPVSGQEIYDLVKMMKELGKTVFVIEQNIDYLLDCVDELLLLHHHQIVKRGSVREVITSQEFRDSGVRLSNRVALESELMSLREGERFTGGVAL